MFLQAAEQPDEVASRSLNSPQTRLINIGARVVRSARAITFQLAEVAIPRDLLNRILAAIDPGLVDGRGAHLPPGADPRPLLRDLVPLLIGPLNRFRCALELYAQQIDVIVARVDLDAECFAKSLQISIEGIDIGRRLADRLAPSNVGFPTFGNLDPAGAGLDEN